VLVNVANIEDLKAQAMTFANGLYAMEMKRKQIQSIGYKSYFRINDKVKA
jgi:hypothetical protein